LAVSLNEQLTPNGGGGLVIPLDETFDLMFKPILPHGVPECACYG
jgi:hypothetical protein